MPGIRLRLEHMWVLHAAPLTQVSAAVVEVATAFTVKWKLDKECKSGTRNVVRGEQGALWNENIHIHESWGKDKDQGRHKSLSLDSTLKWAGFKMSSHCFSKLSIFFFTMLRISIFIEDFCSHFKSMNGKKTTTSVLCLRQKKKKISVSKHNSWWTNSDGTCPLLYPAVRSSICYNLLESKAPSGLGLEFICRH